MGAARQMPRLKRGDVVAFLDAGAYGETKAATFNAEPRPASVLVSGDRADVITERETMRDVLAGSGFRRGCCPTGVRLETGCTRVGGCRRTMSGAEVMTVRGLVSADALGVCLPHEHLLLNVEWIDTRYSLDGILDDEQLIREELLALVAAGGQSVIDTTCTGLRPRSAGCAPVV